MTNGMERHAATASGTRRLGLMKESPLRTSFQKQKAGSPPADLTLPPAATRLSLSLLYPEPDCLKIRGFPSSAHAEFGFSAVCSARTGQSGMQGVTPAMST